MRFLYLSGKYGDALVNLFTSGMPSGGKNSLKVDPNSEENLIENFFQMYPDYKKFSLGSGFIINPAGYFVTNAHLIEKSHTINVYVGESKKEYGVKIIGIDSITDIALLKIISQKNDFTFICLGDSDSASVGEWIMAAGNPFGFSNTVTQGIISAKGRTFELGGTSTKRFESFIQTDASINLGNSGGPLLNYRGEVVGINTAVATNDPGIGFAIPINSAKKVLPSLFKEGKVVRAYLGINLQPVTPLLSKGLLLGTDSGALVTEIADKSPASKAGLRQMDIITSFDGKAVKDADVLNGMIESSKPGKKLNISILRKGKNISLTAVLSELSQPVEEIKTLKKVPYDKFGLYLEDTLPYGSGVTVEDLKYNSPADKAGVSREDIIYTVTVNYTSKKDLKSFKIRNHKDYKKIIESLAGGEIVTFVVNRFGSPVYIALENSFQAHN
jgi:serine protease Do